MDKKIYVLQLQTNTIPAKVIRRLTGYEYSHIGLSLTRDCHRIYSFGRRNLYNTFDAGFNIEEKDGKFFQRFNETTCRVYELDCTHEQYQTLEDIINYMEINAADYDYDFVGIVLRYLGIEKTFENKYVCSYFVADVLDKSNIYKFDKNNCWVEPKDFENMVGAREVYEGHYKHMDAESNHTMTY